MPSHTLTTSIDRAGYPDPGGVIIEVSIPITGTASTELHRITPFAMLDKLAAVSGTIRGRPVCWAMMTLPADVGVRSALVIWPRPDEAYPMTVRTSLTDPP